MTKHRKAQILRRFVEFLCLPVLCCSSLSGQGPGVDLEVHYTTDYGQIASACVNCKWMNGGGVGVQLLFSRHLAAAFDVTVTQAGNIKPLYSLTPGVSYDLQRTTYLTGLSYFPTRPSSRLRPSANVLMGGAYATGALSPANTSGASAGAFALQTGAGLSIQLTDRLAITPVRVDYLLTTFDNPNQGTQGAVRWSAGATFRLRRRQTNVPGE
jgi:opacity protein-like surface antigen